MTSQTGKILQKLQQNPVFMQLFDIVLSRNIYIKVISVYKKILANFIKFSPTIFFIPGYKNTMRACMCLHLPSDSLRHVKIFQAFRKWLKEGDI